MAIDIDIIKDRFDETVGNWDSIVKQASDVDLETIKKCLEDINSPENRMETFVLLVLDALKGGERLIDSFINWKWEISVINDDSIKARLLDIIESGLKKREDGYSLGVFYEIFCERCTELERNSFLRESEDTDPELETRLETMLHERTQELEKEVAQLKEKQRLLQLFRRAEESDDNALYDLVSIFENEGETDNAIYCLCKSASGGNNEAGEELAQRLYREKSYFGARYWFKKVDSKSKEYAQIMFYGLDGLKPERTIEYFERIYPVLEAERLYSEHSFAKAYKLLASIEQIDDDPSGKYLYLFAYIFFNHQDMIEAGNPDKAIYALEKAKGLGYLPAKELYDKVLR